MSKLEGGDRRILCAAVLLHDAVAVEKNSPQRHLASRMAAEQATLMLTRLEWAPADIAAVAHAIEAHSFSAGIPANAGGEDPAGCRSPRRHRPDRRGALLLYRRPHAQRAVRRRRPAGRTSPIRRQAFQPGSLRNQAVQTARRLPDRRRAAHGRAAHRTHAALCRRSAGRGVMPAYRAFRYAHNIFGHITPLNCRSTSPNGRHR
ncbi:hypothetical protein NFX37_13140 [Serratia marcescens]|nr:hypothetical protein NFX37_13140 [Serratia marcescens]